MHDARRNTALGALAVATLAGVGARIWLASRGHNYDMESWTMTADLVVQGKNVYANTFRHPYGPPWFLVLGGLRWLHDTFALGRLGPESFHIVVAAFLSLADVAITWLLFRAFGLVAALFFILNPVSILISGYHSQIDNLALLSGLGAWLMLRPDGTAPSNLSWRRLLGSASLLALSLSTKHVLIFLPIWILLCPPIISRVSQRLACALVSYGLFALSFVPFAFEPFAWAGIRRDVLGYEGWSNRTLLLHVIDLILPPAAFDSLLGLLPHIMLRRLFILLMLVFGWIVARRRPVEMFYLYLLAIVVFTYSMADQYLAIPLIACAVYWRRWPAWVYAVPATLLVYWAGAEAGALPPPQPRWHPYASGLSYQHAQIWLAVLLGLLLWRSSGRRAAREDQIRPELGHQ